jgi:hypothetical protein
MSEQLSPLYELVLDWAMQAREPRLTEYWIQELQLCGIGNIDSLQKINNGSLWNEFIKHISPLLRIKLEMWHKKLDDMSEDYVSRLGTEELCQWLNMRIDKEDWKEAEIVIRTQKINGECFLAMTYDRWKIDGVGSKVANSLSKIAQDVLGIGHKSITLDDTRIEQIITSQIDVHSIIDQVKSSITTPDLNTFTLASIAGIESSTAKLLHKSFKF